MLSMQQRMPIWGTPGLGISRLHKKNGFDFCCTEFVTSFSKMNAVLTSGPSSKVSRNRLSEGVAR